ncbi:FAD-dependent monooxygenase [Saccharopolyspora sp. K220]|uniref:FAD-dependent monooxygenase n=1 Tax=Saccharopolyspora soli TaxID=2926618 RepID=UPI001F561899|nr:FAD-dependent monooxygenase [Saccharopolyspora soli]MCI2422562.1 FAD-dependent monooxygenase [Saccharopolyspora soli]
MTTTVPTLIVGGGIGGLAAALAVARAGRAVHLLERAAEFTEIGAGLQFGPNAIRMLDRLGLLSELLEVAVLPRHGVMRHAITAEPLTTLDLGGAFRERYGYPYVVVHRSDLLSILVDACRAEPGIQLENNKAVVEARADGEAAQVRCADGSAYRAELLVGADGLRSVVRTLVSDDEPVPSGYVAYRGALPMHEVQTEVDNDDVVLWVGPGLHLIQYPVRRGELYNQVAVFRSESFRRGDEVVGPVGELFGRFSETCEEVQRHVSRIETARSWPIYDRDPIPTWVHGPAVLLGDAAHPMLQYLGQGACQALEDALALGDAVGAYGGDITKAVQAYDSVRVPRAGLCQTRARMWGEVWHTNDPVTLGLRDRYMHSREPDDYSELDWLYAADSVAVPA